MNHRTVVIALGFILIAGFSFGAELTSTEKDEAAQKAEAAKKAEAADLAALVDGNNEFALALHRKLAAKSDGNFVMSPFSISTALAIVHAGARGETADEMAKALHFKLPVDRQAKAFKKLLADMNGPEDKAKRKGELSIANALWAQKSFPFRDEFLTLGRDQYQAELRLLDFENDSEAGRKEINGWVEKKTHDKIRELIQPGQVNSRTKLVVTNAVYLNKKWAVPFRKDATKDEEFNNGKEKKKVPMMHGSMDQLYYAGDGVQVLQLPYDDGDLAMLFVLPDEKQEIAKFEQELDWAKLKGWIGKLQEHDVDVILPRVKMASRNSLSKALQEMGMCLAFTSGADFTGMVSSSGVQISEVIHEACMSLDESETEAAAATAVIVWQPVSARIGPFPAKVTFRTDRPFLVLIRERHTNEILFIGRFFEPGK